MSLKSVACISSFIKTDYQPLILVVLKDQMQNGRGTEGMRMGERWEIKKKIMRFGYVQV